MRGFSVDMRFSGCVKVSRCECQVDAMLGRPGATSSQGPRPQSTKTERQPSLPRDVFTGCKSPTSATSCMQLFRHVHVLPFSLIIAEKRQLYFALSNKSSWMDMIGMVDLAKMFHAVVQLIERKAHEHWVHKLMKFWKRYGCIFHLRHSDSPWQRGTGSCTWKSLKTS